MSGIARGYAWPASALSSGDMAVLVALRETTGKPITQMLSQCVQYADTEAIKKQFSAKKVKKNGQKDSKRDRRARLG